MNCQLASKYLKGKIMNNHILKRKHKIQKKLAEEAGYDLKKYIKNSKRNIATIIDKYKLNLKYIAFLTKKFNYFSMFFVYFVTRCLCGILRLYRILFNAFVFCAFYKVKLKIKNGKSIVNFGKNLIIY
jgi:hypothetical protein